MPDNQHLIARARQHINALCVDIADRSVGSEGNRAASVYFEEQVRALGFTTERQTFSCLYWEAETARLEIAGESYPIHPGPYGPACDLTAPLTVISSVEELRGLPVKGHILLLCGPIAATQLMPKNFPFYNPDEHREIIALLENSSALAVVAATGVDPGVAGALSPFPLIEDGDFALPSAYTSEDVGARLASLDGATATLLIESRREPAPGWNVSARKGDGANRLLFCAHIDAKLGTPGAIDNAGGTTVLLLLAELLRDYDGPDMIEIIPFNGEDYYAVPGQLRFLELNRGRLDNIRLAFNIDGVGYNEGDSAFSLYDCSAEMAAAVRQAFAGLPGVEEGPAWYQGDHSIFVQNQVPAAALTCAAFAEVWSKIAHTEHDTAELVEPARLAEAAHGLRRLVAGLHEGRGRRGESA